MSRNSISRDSIIDTMNNLFSQEIAANSAQPNEIDYLRAHSQLNSVRRQVDVFEKYIQYIPPNSKVLDWGCRHAPDAVMIKKVLGDSVEIHGCDFVDAEGYKNFHAYSKLQYEKISDGVKLPYADKSFDVVIAGGVLEHAAMDYESLKELHRIIKDGGKLIITFLPNRFSYTEFISRVTKREGHRRLYGLQEARQMLRHYGFIPCYSGYHQFIPAQQMQKIFNVVWPLNSLLEKLWPTKYFCSSLMLVADRCSVI